VPGRVEAISDRRLDRHDLVGRKGSAELTSRKLHTIANLIDLASLRLDGEPQSVGHRQQVLGERDTPTLGFGLRRLLDTSRPSICFRGQRGHPLPMRTFDLGDTHGHTTSDPEQRPGENQSEYDECHPTHRHASPPLDAPDTA
jgi:hypothetical protein